LTFFKKNLKSIEKIKVREFCEFLWQKNYRIKATKNTEGHRTHKIKEKGKQ